MWKPKRTKKNFKTKSNLFGQFSRFGHNFAHPKILSTCQPLVWASYNLVQVRVHFFKHTNIYIYITQKNIYFIKLVTTDHKWYICYYPLKLIQLQIILASAIKIKPTQRSLIMIIIQCDIFCLISRSIFLARQGQL